jgi:hypothetical protein
MYNDRMRTSKSTHKIEQQKFIYDLIPESDIRRIQGMARWFDNYVEKINSMAEYESIISKLQKDIEDINPSGV